MADAVAIVLKGYPRLSETFIANEIRALERRGLDIRIISLRRPTDRAVHPVHREIVAPVLYLPEYLREAPARILRGWRAARRLPGWRAARRTWLRDLVRDPTPNRVRRFGQAMTLAGELPDGVGRLHAHFLHTPSSVARYAAIMLGMAWSASAHAKDIWMTPGWELAEKLGDCAWAVTCSATARARLAEHAGGARDIDLVYHGIDTNRFPPPANRRPPRDGADPSDPLRLLAVGRAVEKKGFDTLIDALAMLPRALEWRLVHVGGGALMDALRARARERGLASRIDWLGPLTHDAVLAEYRRADLFVLPSRIAADGDRDGLPNVLVEAQSQDLACIASDVSAVPELIEHRATGVLSPPGDAGALADAIAELAGDPALRLRLGRRGGVRVREAFCFESGIDRLAVKFGLAPHPGEAEDPDRLVADERCASPSMHR